jgi:hypothetical protein
MMHRHHPLALVQQRPEPFDEAGIGRHGPRSLADGRAKIEAGHVVEEDRIISAHPVRMEQRRRGRLIDERRLDIDRAQHRFEGIAQEGMPLARHENVEPL